jgi:uncharacterized protein
MSDATQVIDDQGESKFEVVIDGAVAELVYRKRADRLVLIHTEVPDALSGHGIGGQLVKAAVERAARERLTLVPVCPFARDWLQRHPDLAEPDDLCGRQAAGWGCAATSATHSPVTSGGTMTKSCSIVEIVSAVTPMSRQNCLGPPYSSRTSFWNPMMLRSCSKMTSGRFLS